MVLDNGYIKLIDFGTAKKIQDKAALRKEVTGIQRAFKLRNVTTIRSKFKNIIKFLDNICDYMNWVKPSDWQGLVKLYVKVERLYDELEVDDIKAKA